MHPKSLLFCTQTRGASPVVCFYWFCFAFTYILFKFAQCVFNGLFHIELPVQFDTIHVDTAFNSICSVTSCRWNHVAESVSCCSSYTSVAGKQIENCTEC